MYRISVCIALVFSLSVAFGQSENILLKRSYWKEKPGLSDVESAVKTGNDPAAFDAHKFNPLTWAILEDAPKEVIFYLLDCPGNTVNLRAHDGRTPLFWAAYRGNTSLMAELITKGAKLDLIDDHGMSVVNFAASTGQTSVALFDLCIENGVQLSHEKTPNGATPLLLVMPYLTSPAEIAYFTQKGLLLTHTDAHGNNAFTYAARTGNEAILNFLKTAGIDPKANNHAAMLFACKGTRSKTNTKETFQLLEKLGVSPAAIDDEEKNAFHYLAQKHTDTAVYNYFLSAGVNLNHQDRDGNVPLMEAVSSSSPKIVAFLLRAGAQSTMTNAQGENALHVAAKRGEPEMLKVIILNNTNLNAPSKDGLTALHLAAMTTKNIDLLKILVDAGADRTIQTPFEETAYTLACENELLQDKIEALHFLKP